MARKEVTYYWFGNDERSPKILSDNVDIDDDEALNKLFVESGELDYDDEVILVKVVKRFSKQWTPVQD